MIFLQPTQMGFYILTMPITDWTLFFFNDACKNITFSNYLPTHIHIHNHCENRYRFDTESKLMEIYYAK